MTDAGPRGLIPGGTLAPGVRRPVAPAAVAAFPDAPAPQPETTALPPEKEQAYRQWLQANKITDADDPRAHYDYKGAFLAGVGRDPASAHFPDTFKQHGHETFSQESKYSKGPGDGGTWQGEKFIAGPTTGPLGAAPAAPPPKDAPYGMRPGQRRLLPGINDQPPPIDMSQPMRFVMPDGSKIPLVSTNKRDNEIVDKLGQSLFNGSGDDREKKVAKMTLEWGRSMVGQMPIDEIQKTMSTMWDHNVGNVIKRELSRDRIAAAAANRGANARNPNLPGKADEQAANNAFDMAEKVAGRHIRSNQYGAVNTMLGQFDRIEAMASSNSPMAERVAPMVILLNLTGKASRESEQTGITRGAGIWEEYANKLRQLDPNNPGLTRGYIAELKKYIQVERDAVVAHKKAIATAAANDVLEQIESVYGPEVAKQQARRIYSGIYGEFKNARFNPDEDPGNDPSVPLARPGMTPMPKAAPPKAAAAPRAAAAAPRAAAAAPRAAAPAAPAPKAAGVQSILDKLRAKKK